MNNRNLKLFLAAAALFTGIIACSKKEDPVPVEQELITTLQLSITDTNGSTQVFSYRIENGFGSTTEGSIHVDTLRLAAGNSYTVAATLLNEKITPAEDITQEVMQENEEHLFLYNTVPASGAGSITMADGNLDDALQPFNQTIRFLTGSAGSGTLTVNLMHNPTDKNGTTPAAAGGETDVEAVFPVVLD